MRSLRSGKYLLVRNSFKFTFQSKVALQRGAVPLLFPTSANHWVTEIITFYFQLNSNLLSALLWNATQTQTEMKTKHHSGVAQKSQCSEQCSRAPLKDQGIEPLQN